MAAARSGMEMPMTYTCDAGNIINDYQAQSGSVLSLDSLHAGSCGVLTGLSSF